MSEEIMNQEAFNEIIDNLEHIGTLTDYGKKGIKYNVKKLQEELKQEKEKNKELELEKEINQEAINIANNQLCNYELGYQAGLHKEMTATEVVIRKRENFIIQQQIKRLKDTIHRLHKAMDEGNEKVKQEYISKDKIKKILQEIDIEYVKAENTFNSHFEKVNRDMQDYYIQKEATSIMQELSWIKGRIEELLEEE